MTKFALFVRLEAKLGQEAAVASFPGRRAAVGTMPSRVPPLGSRCSSAPRHLASSDAFADEEGRQASTCRRPESPLR